MNNSSPITSQNPTPITSPVETVKTPRYCTLRRVLFVGIFTALGATIAAIQTTVNNRIDFAATAIGAAAGCALSLVILFFRSCIQGKPTKPVESNTGSASKKEEETKKVLEETKDVVEETKKETTATATTVTTTKLTPIVPKTKSSIFGNSEEAETESPEEQESPINTPMILRAKTTTFELPVFEASDALRNFISDYVWSFLQPYLTGKIRADNEPVNRPPMINQLFDALKAKGYEEKAEVVVGLAVEAYFLQAARGIYMKKKFELGDLFDAIAEIEDILVSTTDDHSLQQQLDKALAKLSNFDYFWGMTDALELALKKDFPEVTFTSNEISERAKIAIAQWCCIFLENNSEAKNDNSSEFDMTPEAIEERKKKRQLAGYPTR